MVERRNETDRQGRDRTQDRTQEGTQDRTQDRDKTGKHEPFPPFPATSHIGKHNVENNCCEPHTPRTTTLKPPWVKQVDRNGPSPEGGVPDGTSGRHPSTKKKEWTTKGGCPWRGPSPTPKRKHLVFPNSLLRPVLSPQASPPPSPAELQKF